MCADAIFCFTAISDFANLHLHAGYMVQHLGIAEAEVGPLCTELYAAHGTTYAGLVARGYKIDPHSWHSQVHAPLEYERLLGPDLVTRSILQSMTVPRFIVTNADARHAQVCV